MINNSRPKFDEVLTIRLPIEILEKLSKLADITDTRVSALVRRAIAEFLPRLSASTRTKSVKKSRPPVKVL